MMTLKEYRKSVGIDQRTFGSLVKVSQATVSKLERGSMSPNLDLAFSIEDATGGAVPAHIWRSSAQAAE